MKKIVMCVFVLLIGQWTWSQVYTNYITGNQNNVDVAPTRGIVLAGGATDNDNAMKWMLQRANGGDVLVLRASGADGYNAYFFSELGVAVNRVETIVCHNAASGSDLYIIQRIQEAECIFFAGGDQANYINFWMNTPVENALQDFIAIKQGVIGGTSAGMAILGGHVFTAQEGTITSATALNNPFALAVTISHDQFLTNPGLENVITDTHYDDPDRRGRHVTFMAQMMYNGCDQPLGIACNEYVAVALDENGMAHCFGEYPSYDEYVYFLRLNCAVPNDPEVMEPFSPLTWNRDNSALKVYRANARLDGSSTFDLNDWLANNGDGQWQNWWVEEGGIYFQENAETPACAVSVTTPTTPDAVRVEIGQHGTFEVISNTNGRCILVDAFGRLVVDAPISVGRLQFAVPNAPSGVYAAVIVNANGAIALTSKFSWIH